MSQWQEANLPAPPGGALDLSSFSDRELQELILRKLIVLEEEMRARAPADRAGSRQTLTIPALILFAVAVFVPVATAMATVILMLAMRIGG